jgi:serine/threonine protein kinase
MNYGSLNFILNYKYSSGIKNVNIIATIMKCCVEGLICLNKNNLYHRDIKAGNILLSDDGSIKLGDFGVAACIKPGAKKNSVVGSVNWMAPEVVKRESYDEKVFNYFNF